MKAGHGVGICLSSTREMEETGRPWGLWASLPNLGEHQADSKAYLRNQGGGHGNNVEGKMASCGSLRTRLESRDTTQTSFQFIKRPYLKIKKKKMGQ